MCAVRKTVPTKWRCNAAVRNDTVVLPQVGVRSLCLASGVRGHCASRAPARTIEIAQADTPNGCLLQTNYMGVILTERATHAR
jgi:hypothetical protein